MPRSAKGTEEKEPWGPIPDPEGRYSTGIADFDRLLGGGFQRGSMALIGLDETVGREELDLLLFPTLLNFLYHSRSIVAVLPSRDSPGDFRQRLIHLVTRRRFDTRVRVIDYADEDENTPYVVNLITRARHNPSERPSPKERARMVAKMVAAERAVGGQRMKAYLEMTAFEIPDTEVGPEKAAQSFFHGVKRSRQAGNLMIGLLGPGVGCADAVRRVADTEFALHRDEVGLTVRGVRPTFPTHVVTTDPGRGSPHVVFVPRPG